VLGRSEPPSSVSAKTVCRAVTSSNGRLLTHPRRRSRRRETPRTRLQTAPRPRSARQDRCVLEVPPRPPAPGRLSSSPLSSTRISGIAERRRRCGHATVRPGGGRAAGRLSPGLVECPAHHEVPLRSSRPQGAPYPAGTTPNIVTSRRLFLSPSNRCRLTILATSYERASCRVWAARATASRWESQEIAKRRIASSLKPHH